MSSLYNIEKNKYSKIFRFSAPINEKESIEKTLIEFIDISKEKNKKLKESVLSFDENSIGNYREIYNNIDGKV